MRRLSRAVPLAAVLVLALAAGASAFWHTGSGTATAIVQTGPVTLGPGSAGAGLTPGGSTDVEVVATNPNVYDASIASLVLDTSAGTNGFDVDPDHSACDTSVLHFAPQDNGGPGWSVPANDTLDIDMLGALTMDNDASNACQGATFTVHLMAGPA